MNELNSKKRYLIQLRSRAIIFLGVIVVLSFVFKFSWNSFEIKLLVFVFGIMAIANSLIYFFHHLKTKNMTLFEYLEDTLGAERYNYIWYIVGAVFVGLISTKLLIG